MFFQRKKIILAVCSFTLIEVMVTVGVLSILTTVSFLSLVSYKSNKNFHLDSEAVYNLIASAQTRAMYQEDTDYAWGVKLTNSTTSNDFYEIFSGSSYSASSVVEKREISSASDFTNPASGFSKTIIFTARSGTSSPNSIAIKKKNSGDINIVSVSSSGRISGQLESGLVGYWPFDEGEGSVTYDAAGTSNGSLVIGPTGTQTSVSSAWSSGGTGVLGGALYFDGTDDYIDLSNLPVSTDSGGKTSVSFWLYWMDVNSDMPFGFTDYDLIFSKTYGFGFNTNHGDLYGISETGFANSWKHIVAVFDNGTIENNLVYVNGVLETSSQRRGTSLSRNVGASARIASWMTGSSNCFKGIIDDVKIYNRALSEDEVKILYENY